MHSKRLALVATAFSLLGTAPLQAQLVGTYQTGNCFPFGCPWGTRYQQVYAASNWSDPVSITSFSFFDTYNSANLVSGTFEFYLSTTSAAVNGLSSTFNNNLGADNSFFAKYVLSANNPAPSILTFSGNPFTYDPSLGNLLIDMRISGISGGGAFLDAMSNSGGLFSRMQDFGGGYAGWGLVTEFNTAPGTPDTPTLLTVQAPISTVPEPSSILLLATGLLALAIVLGRRRRASDA